VCKNPRNRHHNLSVVVVAGQSSNHLADFVKMILRDITNQTLPGRE
jgi:hypothetical protein